MIGVDRRFLFRSHRKAEMKIHKIFREVRHDADDELNYQIDRHFVQGEYLYATNGAMAVRMPLGRTQATDDDRSRLADGRFPDMETLEWEPGLYESTPTAIPEIKCDEVTCPHCDETFDYYKQDRVFVRRDRLPLGSEYLRILQVHGAWLFASASPDHKAYRFTINKHGIEGIILPIACCTDEKTGLRRGGHIVCPHPCSVCAAETHHTGTEYMGDAESELEHDAAMFGVLMWHTCKHCDFWQECPVEGECPICDEGDSGDQEVLATESTEGI
jgi:hypothetical protein